MRAETMYLGLRIPRAVVVEAKVAAGDEVDVSVEAGAIVRSFRGFKAPWRGRSTAELALGQNGCPCYPSASLQRRTAPRRTNIDSQTEANVSCTAVRLK